VLGYAAAFYCLSVVLKSIPVGIAYAIWSGVGIILIALIGFFVFKQHLDLAAIIGLVLIIAGVVVINVFSNSVSH
ncbi:SMR family transporter, partial [Phocaeicola vulgatus]